ncbi:hypothetical protein [Bosea sp. (in: a-proteobacteria)]|uniref:hypothetical protein n=1 Tax=Bosea sp. (in: a-proteobacteria) TaxID=1871050 RepID=UPI0025C52A54|nr:hypothetical protein [Bosea sp. (in: a-proteobacteria)]
MTVGFGERKFHRAGDRMYTRHRIGRRFIECDESGIGPAAAQSRHHGPRLLRPFDRIVTRFLLIDRLFIGGAAAGVKRPAARRRLLPPARPSYEAA